MAPSLPPGPRPRPGRSMGSISWLDDEDGASATDGASAGGPAPPAGSGALSATTSSSGAASPTTTGGASAVGSAGLASAAFFGGGACFAASGAGSASGTGVGAGAVCGAVATGPGAGAPRSLVRTISATGSTVSATRHRRARPRASFGMGRVALQANANSSSTAIAANAYRASSGNSDIQDPPCVRRGSLAAPDGRAMPHIKLCADNDAKTRAVRSPSKNGDGTHPVPLAAQGKPAHGPAFLFRRAPPGCTSSLPPLDSRFYAPHPDPCRIQGAHSRGRPHGAGPRHHARGEHQGCP